MATSGIDSTFTAALLKHTHLQATTAAIQAATNVVLVGPLKLLFLSAVRTADNGSDTEISTGSGYTQGTGFSGLTFAAPAAGATSSVSSNVAATITNMPASTWAGNRIVDTAARTLTTDGSTTNASAAISSLSACFSSSDVGATITGTNIPGSTTISSVQDAGHATMSANATASGSNIAFTITRSSVNTTFWAALASSKTVNLGDTVTVPSGSLTDQLS